MICERKKSGGKSYPQRVLEAWNQGTLAEKSLLRALEELFPP